MQFSGASLRPSVWWNQLATITEGEAAPAADTTALSLVALLVFCMICFLGGAMVLRKREQHLRQDQDAEQIQQAPVESPEAKRNREASDEEQPPKRQPWERRADWWKDQP